MARSFMSSRASSEIANSFARLARGRSSEGAGFMSSQASGGEVECGAVPSDSGPAKPTASFEISPVATTTDSRACLSAIADPAKAKAAADFDLDALRRRVGKLACFNFLLVPPFFFLGYYKLGTAFLRFVLCALVMWLQTTTVFFDLRDWATSLPEGRPSRDAYWAYFHDFVWGTRKTWAMYFGLYGVLCLLCSSAIGTAVTAATVGDMCNQPPCQGVAPHYDERALLYYPFVGRYLVAWGLRLHHVLGALLVIGTLAQVGWFLGNICAAKKRAGRCGPALNADDGSEELQGFDEDRAVFWRELTHAAEDARLDIIAGVTNHMAVRCIQGCCNKVGKYLGGEFDHGASFACLVLLGMCPSLPLYVTLLAFARGPFSTETLGLGQIVAGSFWSIFKGIINQVKLIRAMCAAGHCGIWGPILTTSLASFVAAGSIARLIGIYVCPSHVFDACPLAGTWGCVDPAVLPDAC